MTFRLESKRIPYTRARPRPYPLLPYLDKYPLMMTASDFATGARPGRSSSKRKLQKPWQEALNA
jgi:hypothetical protein